MTMRRILATVLLGAALAVLFVAPAHGFTVTGGTPQQQADVYATINAMQFPSLEWVESKVGSVRIEILDSYPPYWVTVLDSTTDFRVDVFSARAAGVAWPGNIRIHSYYTPGQSTFFREIVSHEFAHQVWFALLHVPGASTEWRARVEAGLNADSSDWYQNYVESHAEQLRVAAWSPLYYMTVSPRTHLNILGNAAVQDFHARWTGSTPPTTIATTTTTRPPTTTTTSYTPPTRTTTTTTNGGTTSTTAAPPTTSTTAAPTTTTTQRQWDPFRDVTRDDDSELWSAAWWGVDSGIVFGYANGNFGSYDTLTRRHAALMIGRAGGAINVYWVFDYGVPTRGELAAMYPGYVWDSERWSESLLRSQLLRLMWRSVK